MGFSERAGVEQPWGAWLRQREDGQFIDEHGGVFRTVRECFLVTRLRMSNLRWARYDELLELLLAVLVAHARSGRSISELDLDLFDASMGYRAFVHEWLQVEGLLQSDHQT